MRAPRCPPQACLPALYGLPQAGHSRPSFRLVEMVMWLTKSRAYALYAFSMGLSVAFSAASAQGIPSVVGRHQNDPAEKRAIEHVLSLYTTAVSKGDEATFSSILLNDQVPFSSTAELHLDKAEADHLQTSRYAKFKQSVFESGKHYQQQFYHVHIEQDGALAQASLDFVTQDAQTHEGGYGWKSLTLLKVDGQWKIASEFYTVYPLPG
jgi:Putative lumazine-binding